MHFHAAGGSDSKWSQIKAVERRLTVSQRARDNVVNVA